MDLIKKKRGGGGGGKRRELGGLEGRQKQEALAIKTKGSSQGAVQYWGSAASHEQAKPPESVEPCTESGAICHLIY